MHQDEISRTDAAPENSDRPQQTRTDFRAELERAQLLATQVSGWGGNMLGLARLELQLALQSLPPILGLALALLPLAGLTWISMSILLAWFAYAATGIVAIGLFALFALQLCLLLLCLWRLNKLRERSSFPETRQQWHLFLEEMKSRQQESDS